MELKSRKTLAVGLSALAIASIGLVSALLVSAADSEPASPNDDVVGQVRTPAPADVGRR